MARLADELTRRLMMPFLVLATFRRKIEALNLVDSETASDGWCMNVRIKHFRSKLL
jgi:hypothetical protein